MLQEDLQNAVRTIDELKARNRVLEAKLLLVGARKRDTVPAKQKLQRMWWSVTGCCATLEQNMQM